MVEVVIRTLKVGRAVCRLDVFLLACGGLETARMLLNANFPMVLLEWGIRTAWSDDASWSIHIGPLPRS